MVVISIISLLSSVVLASVSAARQKAENTKIVSEMKSIQTALELYRNQFGVYPQIQVDEDYPCTSQVGLCMGGWNDFVKTYLVDNKFLSKVPQSKNSPNSCINSDCFSYGDTFYYGFYSMFTAPLIYYMCGEKRASSYVLGYITTKELNLPKFTVYYYGQTYTGYNWYNADDGYEDLGEVVGVNEYCLTPQ